MAQLNELDMSPDLIAEAVKRALTKLGQDGDGKGLVKNDSGKLNAKNDYPLGTKRPELIKSATGKSLDDITLDNALAGKLGFDDITISPDTLEYQAQVAESIHRPNLAGNFRRAAEMTRIPNERLLEMYNMLRPRRVTKQELLDMANELESKYQAKICAGLVREAAEVYEKRNCLKR